jgi:probable rRNA maturation factor
MTRGRPHPTAGRARVEIDIAVDDWRAAGIERLAVLAEAAAGARAGEISIRLATDAEVQSLNASYRGLDKPTNVLSFPAGGSLAARPGAPLGDIILALETARREAGELGITLADHAAHLVVHGVLHLAGHDHETEAQAEAMEAEERRILAAAGIADPYVRLDAAAERSDG